MLLNISQLQEKNNRLLKEVSRICEKENIPYIGMFGTMLGAIRHKGPIPWDSDVDIAVPINQMDRFIDAMEKYLPEDCCVVYRKDENQLRLFPRVGLRKYSIRILHVDVYPIIGLPDEIEKQKRLFYWIHKVVGVTSVKNYRYSGIKEFVARLIRIITFFVSRKMLVKWYDYLCKKYPYETATIVGCSNASTGYKRTYKKEDLEDTFLVEFSDFMIRIPKAYDAVLTTLYHNYLCYPPEEERNKELNRIFNIESC